MVALPILWEKVLKQFYHYIICPLSDIVVARMQDVVLTLKILFYRDIDGSSA